MCMYVCVCHACPTDMLLKGVLLICGMLSLSFSLLSYLLPLLPSQIITDLNFDILVVFGPYTVLGGTTCINKRCMNISDCRLIAGIPTEMHQLSSAAVKRIDNKS